MCFKKVFEKMFQPLNTLLSFTALSSFMSNNGTTLTKVSGDDQTLTLQLNHLRLYMISKSYI